MSNDDDLVLQGLPLTGDAGDAFTAIAALLAAGHMADEDGEGLHEEAFALASRLVARAIGAAGAPTDAELRIAAVERGEAAEEAADEMGFELPDSFDQLSEDLVELTEEVIREAALEEHTHDAYLALQGDTDDLLLVVVPVSEAGAHVGLLDSLFARLELGIHDDPLGVLERTASAWWFHRLLPEAADDLAPIREQEWSLVDRETAASGLSFLAEMVEQEDVLAALPPRQRHLAHRLLESVTGAWRVRERTGDDAVFVSLADGTEYAVREHEEEYAAGAVATGRLIPFGDGTWLRSPGTQIIPDAGPEWTPPEADAPRSVPPARSASEARKILAAAEPILQQVKPDEVLTAWLDALTRMSRKGTGGSKSKKRR